MVRTQTLELDKLDLNTNSENEYFCYLNQLFKIE